MDDGQEKSEIEVFMSGGVYTFKKAALSLKVKEV